MYNTTSPYSNTNLQLFCHNRSGSVDGVAGDVFGRVGHPKNAEGDRRRGHGPIRRGEIDY